jgi:hypothetical protein
MAIYLQLSVSHMLFVFQRAKILLIFMEFQSVQSSPHFSHLLLSVVFNVILNHRSNSSVYISNGTIVSMSSIDLSQAFDTMSYFAVFIEVVKLKLPNQLTNKPEKGFVAPKLVLNRAVVYRISLHLHAAGNRQKEFYLPFC